MMQVPMVNRLLPPGRRAGILTISAATMTAEHLARAGVPGGTPVMGTDGGREFTRAILGDEDALDVAAAERDILDAGAELVRRNPEVGAIVLECTNMAPYARALAEHVGMPVHDIYSFVTWFHAGIAPRDFGHPASDRRQWRER
jgi:Asp/Glu/hydantoin racemase